MIDGEDLSQIQRLEANRKVRRNDRQPCGGRVRKRRNI